MYHRSYSTVLRAPRTAIRVLRGRGLPLRFSPSLVMRPMNVSARAIRRAGLWAVAHRSMACVPIGVCLRITMSGQKRALKAGIGTVFCRFLKSLKAIVTLRVRCTMPMDRLASGDCFRIAGPVIPARSCRPLRRVAGKILRTRTAFSRTDIFPYRSIILMTNGYRRQRRI